MVWVDALLGAVRKTGRDPSPGLGLNKWFTDAGFENIVHQRFKWPLGPWAKDPKLKEVGMFNLAQANEGLEAFSLRLMIDVLGWTTEEVHVLLANVRKELKDPAVHVQFD